MSNNSLERFVQNVLGEFLGSNAWKMTSRSLVPLFFFPFFFFFFSFSLTPSAALETSQNAIKTLKT